MDNNRGESLSNNDDPLWQNYRLPAGTRLRVLEVLFDVARFFLTVAKIAF
jgi:hypothetical protein